MRFFVIFCVVTFVASVFAQNVSLYVGCYQDNVNTRILPYQKNNLKLNITECVNLCLSKNYKYAGLQDGGKCWCGNTLIQKAKLQNISCNVFCIKEPNIVCGGTFKNSIYFTDKIKLPHHPLSPYPLPLSSPQIIKN